MIQNKGKYFQIIEQILLVGQELGASDIHLSSKHKPLFRVDGDIVSSEKYSEGLRNEDLTEILKEIMNSDFIKRYEEDLDADFSFQAAGSRYRVNAFKTMNGVSIAMREIPVHIASFDDLGLPQSVRELGNANSGLILVVGPTGSGKSTTIASIIDYINLHYPYHIVTIEDPIEFVHQSKKSMINQREVGHHTKSFSRALRSSLREDPDIILVGELRDNETIDLALTAAETGHLVFGTLHTNSASQTIHRIINSFPENDKASVKNSLADSLRAVVSQRLLKKKTGGRCAAFEVLIANSAIRNLVREDNVPQIDSMIEIGKKVGMVTLKDSLKDLYVKGLISDEVAKTALLSAND